jgi:hypothetical protein
MPLSTDIRLPKSQVPKFPDRCVVCGQEHPDDTVQVSTRAIGWWTWALWLPGRKFAVQVPACSWCGVRLRRQHFFRWLVTIVCAVAAMVLVFPILEGMDRHVRKWVGLGAVLVCLSPWFAWEIFFPPPIDLTAYSDCVDYEFRDTAYAADFALLNEDLPEIAEGRTSD